MLEEMRIRNLGVIEDAVLELAAGLTVVTGETGAGKTMVVTGLGLLFGGRADAGAVRPGADAALVEGRILADADSPAVLRAEEAGGQLDDMALLLSRSVSREGRSRAHLGGRAVPVAVLAELGDELVAVHGQSDQQRLLQPARQREALDRFAGAALEQTLERYGAAYRALRETDSELLALTTRARERAQEAALLRFGLDEIEAAGPRADEDDELAAEEQRLAHTDALRTAAAGAHETLLGDPENGGGDAVGRVGAARLLLRDASGHDPELGALGDRLAEVSYLLSDVASDLASYATRIETDPVRLAAVQERRSLLTSLARKYGEVIDVGDGGRRRAGTPEVLGWARTSARRLVELEGDDERVDELQSRRDRLGRELGELAGTLSGQRVEAAARFADAVSAELTGLAMPHARLVVSVTSTELEPEPGPDGAEPGPDGAGLRIGGRILAFGPHGVDDVELQLAAHAGAPRRPLAKGASGGELSRVMLAAEVVFAGADPVPTFVFDEVDAGVGGRAAGEVGRRLARLARTAQVLVVTHLPQVAAYADRHLLVVKSDDGTVTRSGVVALTEQERVAELARMLAGHRDSATARAHAGELLQSARNETSGSAPERGGSDRPGNLADEDGAPRRRRARTR